MTAPTNAPGTAVVTTTEPAAIAYPLRSPVLDVMRSEDARAQIVPLLPKGVDYETVMIEVYRASTMTPDILKCEPTSVIRAVGDCVRSGLIIGKEIHLVPVGGKLDAWTDYKGDITLVVRSGAARFVDAQVVHEGDVFDYALGDNPYVKHKPPLRNRGPMIAGYAIAHITPTMRKIVVMSLEDVELVRAKSKQWNANKVRECPPWYMQKTCIHRVCKALPKNPALAAVLALFEHQQENDRDDEALDPSKRIDAPSNVAPPVDVKELESKFEDAPPPAPAQSKAFLFPLPFGRGPMKGRPIGELSDKDLADARDYARRKGTYPQFLDMSDELLEQRRSQASS